MSGLQILALVSGLAGFGASVAATVSNEWRATSRASSVITATWVLQGLWNNCAGNAIGALHCRPHHTILQLEAGRSLPLMGLTQPRVPYEVTDFMSSASEANQCTICPMSYIQACRALMIAAVCLGFFGSIFALVGMKCTKIGGSDQTKARIACFAGVTFIFSGISSLSACSLYAHRITQEFFDPMFVAQKYELGAALFIGWAGSVLCILGGCMLCYSIAGSFKSHSQKTYMYKSSVSHVSALPKGGHGTPGHPRLAPQLSNSSRNQHFDKNEYV